MSNLYVSGNCLFVRGKSWISKGIQFVTKSEFSHVGAFYNEQFIFETHQKTNAKLSFFKKEYLNKSYTVLDPLLTEQEKASFRILCKKYDGAKYSGWDIFFNFTFAWLPTKARRRTVSFFSKKSVMLCSELIARMLYEVNPEKYHYLAYFEGFTPSDLYKVGLDNNWKVIKEG